MLQKRLAGAVIESRPLSLDCRIRRVHLPFDHTMPIHAPASLDYPRASNGSVIFCRWNRRTEQIVLTIVTAQFG